MVVIQCPCDGCEYETADMSEAVTVALLNAHTAGTHNAPVAGNTQQRRRTPKVDRPVLKDNMTEESWNAFLQSWNIFVRGNDVEDAELTVQLYSACDMSLKGKLTAMDQDILQKPVQDILDMLKNITVTPIARTVKRKELLQMSQDAGEKI